MVRNVVLSDTGGWLPQLLNTFDRLGIDAEASTMPADLRVIHCGDLIHKGPYSTHLLAIVTGLMVNNPGQWVQLMGNHEAQHLPGAPRFWSCDCSPDDVGLMNVLHREGLLSPTFGLVDDRPLTVPDHPELTVGETSVFFSHGGLTQGFWKKEAAAATDPREAARLLNSLDLEVVARPGLMLGEHISADRVGPVWAVGNTEVFHTWRERIQAMPFTQFHGHTTSFSYDRKRWWPGLELFQKSTTLLPEQRAVVTELNNNLMLGVDPGFNERQPRIGHQTWFEFETNS